MRRSSRIAEKTAKTKLLRNCSVPCLPQEPSAKKNRVDGKPLNLPAHILLDILKCMNRDALDKIHETTRLINDIIKRDFASKPLRIIDENTELIIRRDENNVLLLKLTRPFQSRKCLVPIIPGWQSCDQYREECEHSYPIDEMRPFLGTYMRFRKAIIEIDEGDVGLPSYSPEQVTLLESMSHIWSGQVLTIRECSANSIESLKRMFGSCVILQCRSLMYKKSFHVHSNDPDEDMTSSLMETHTCSKLNTLHTIYYSWPMKAKDLVSLTRYKAAHPQSDTVLVILGRYRLNSHSTLDALETIKKEFSSSSVPCMLRTIIEFVYRGGTNILPENLDFHLENSQTKEVLQLRDITKQEAKEKFDVVLFKYASNFESCVAGRALILERFGIVSS
ncbi:hypothetical protein Ddc_12974 [Ditylenchus destructor]|nr:hypothetical protein Ddc_12974 [Ditylenchus destructor]